MQIRLLGPVDVVVRGEPRPVHGLRRKTVLTVLALHGGEVVSTGQLTDAVWGEDAPPTVVNSLQSHLSYLRGVLGVKSAILARPPGYVLQLPSDGTDVQVAERLLEQGVQATDSANAVRLLQDALALWRGRPLARCRGSGLAVSAGGASGPAPDADPAGIVGGQAGRGRACPACS